MSVEDELIKHIKLSFTNSQKHISKLNSDILSMDGMTGTLTKHFYNNLLDKPNFNYLHVGTWKGSSLCSAMFGNNSNIVAIDNFSDFGSPKDEFLANLDKYKGDNTVLFLEQDCFSVDISSFPKFNIYIYDGPHQHNDIYRALVYFYNAFDDTFIYVIDDWNWDHVRNATYQAIGDLNLQIIFEKKIQLTWDNSHTPHLLAKRSWWNGICVFLFKKI